MQAHVDLIQKCGRLTANGLFILINFVHGRQPVLFQTKNAVILQFLNSAFLPIEIQHFRFSHRIVLVKVAKHRNTVLLLKVKTSLWLPPENQRILQGYFLWIYVNLFRLFKSRTFWPNSSWVWVDAWCFHHILKKFREAQKDHEGKHLWQRAHCGFERRSVGQQNCPSSTSTMGSYHVSGVAVVLLEKPCRMLLERHYFPKLSS